MTARACQNFNVWCVASREAQIEKKMARREAARERDASPDIVKLPGGGDVMGGDDSLEAAKARHAPFSLRLALGVPRCHQDSGTAQILVSSVLSHSRIPLCMATFRV